MSSELTASAAAVTAVAFLPQPVVGPSYHSHLEPGESSTPAYNKLAGNAP